MLKILENISSLLFFFFPPSFPCPFRFRNFPLSPDVYAIVTTFSYNRSQNVIIFFVESLTSFDSLRREREFRYHYKRYNKVDYYIVAS